MGFQEYPKMMSHPHHKDAVWVKNEKIGPFEPGTTMLSAEMFPPVTVTTMAQEQYYASRGYRPNSIPDPQAYEQAMLESTLVAGYVNNDYPKWKYSKVDIPVIVKSKAEEDALEGEWFDSPAFATADDINPNPSSLPANLAEIGDDGDEPGAEEQVKIDKRSKAYKEAQKAQA